MFIKKEKKWQQEIEKNEDVSATQEVIETPKQVSSNADTKKRFYIWGGSFLGLAAIVTAIVVPIVLLTGGSSGVKKIQPNQIWDEILVSEFQGSASPTIRTFEVDDLDYAEGGGATATEKESADFVRENLSEDIMYLSFYTTSETNIAAINSDLQAAATQLSEDLDAWTNSYVPPAPGAPVDFLDGYEVAMTKYQTAVVETLDANNGGYISLSYFNEEVLTTPIWEVEVEAISNVVDLSDTSTLIEFNATDEFYSSVNEAMNFYVI